MNTELLEMFQQSQHVGFKMLIKIYFGLVNFYVLKPSSKPILLPGRLPWNWERCCSSMTSSKEKLTYSGAWLAMSQAIWLLSLASLTLELISYTALLSDVFDIEPWKSRNHPPNQSFPAALQQGGGSQWNSSLSELSSSYILCLCPGRVHPPPLNLSAVCQGRWHFC